MKPKPRYAFAASCAAFGSEPELFADLVFKSDSCSILSELVESYLEKVMETALDTMDQEYKDVFTFALDVQVARGTHEFGACAAAEFCFTLRAREHHVVGVCFGTKCASLGFLAVELVP